MTQGPWTDAQKHEDRAVVAFGEALVRLSSGYRRLRDTSDLSVDVGGSELNVLTALSQLGHRSRWVTAAAGDEFGRRIMEHASRYGVEVASAAQAGGRTPLYFVEMGAPPRPTAIHYDRAQSALALAPAEVFEWKALLEGARWFHSTGITLALGPGARAASLAAYEYARRSLLPTSFDLNHRHRMWSWRAALPHYREVLILTDVLFASPHDLRSLTGSTGDGRVLMELASAQYGVRAIVMRSTPQSGLGGTTVRTEALVDGTYAESTPRIARPIDPLGGGDAATAAFLAAAFQGEDLTAMVERASWACLDKQSMPGDTWVTERFAGAPAETDRAVLR